MFNPVRALALSITLLALMTTSLAGAEPIYERQVGEARSVKDNRLLYREEHYVARTAQAPLRRVVMYRCPDGAAFGRKVVDYTPSRVRPDFALTDARWNYQEGVATQENGLRIFVLDVGADAEKASMLAFENELVADAGYDEFVRIHWDKLVAGDKVKLDFIVPARRTFYGFVVRKERIEKVDDSDLLVLALGLRGFLGLFVPDIEVAYDLNNRALRRFVGVTNLRDGAGDNYEARIDFAAEPLPLTEADYVAADSLALDGKCP